jgi:hypothetical protein
MFGGQIADVIGILARQGKASFVPYFHEIAPFAFELLVRSTNRLSFDLNRTKELQFGGEFLFTLLHLSLCLFVLL